MLDALDKVALKFLKTKPVVKLGAAALDRIIDEARRISLMPPRNPDLGMTLEDVEALSRLAAYLKSLPAGLTQS